ncbi:MAG: DNA polymerase III subunit chi [Hyphomicrobiales bacterium]
MDIAFYHLQSTSLGEALPQLLGKCLEREWRCVVQLGDAERIAPLDEHLWTFSDAQFLPHASTVSAGDEPDPNPDRHPVWLTDGEENPNKAVVRFFVEGAYPQAGSALDGYTRIILMFDGNSGETVTAARQSWKFMRDAGHSLSYWKQSDSGAWKRADG